MIDLVVAASCLVVLVTFLLVRRAIPAQAVTPGTGNVVPHAARALQPAPSDVLAMGLLSVWSETCAREAYTAFHDTYMLCAASHAAMQMAELLEAELAGRMRVLGVERRLIVSLLGSANKDLVEKLSHGCPNSVSSSARSSAPRPRSARRVPCAIPHSPPRSPSPDAPEADRGATDITPRAIFETAARRLPALHRPAPRPPTHSAPRILQLTHHSQPTTPPQSLLNYEVVGANRNSAAAGHGAVVVSLLGAELSERNEVVKVRKGGAAAAGGMMRGDVVTRCNGFGVSSSRDLATLLAKMQPHDLAVVNVLRQGAVLALILTLE